MKQLKRTPYFLVLGIFLFLSCQTEEIPVTENRQKQTRQVTKVSFSTFKKQTGLVDFKTTFEIPKSSNGAILQRKNNGYTPADFIIDTKEITQTIAGEKTSYVFSITPVKGEIEDKRFYLVVYNKDGKWLEMIIQADYSVDKDGDASQSGFKEIYASSGRGLGCIIIYSWVLKCNGRGECAGGVCDKCSICLRGFADRLCPPINKQDYLDGGFTKPGGGGAGGGGGGGSSNPNPNPDPELIIELPLPLLPDPRNNDPCKELKKMMQNTKIEESYTGPNGLKSKVNENIEYGFAFKRTPGYDDVEPITRNYANPTTLNMTNFIGGKYYGASHTHINYVTSENVPMFPAPDIDYLFKVAAKYDWEGVTPRNRDYSIFVFTLTVPQGTYAIKIKDWLKFTYVMNNSVRYGEFKQKIEREYNKIDNSNIDKLIKTLLKIMNDSNLGVGLYEAEQDFSNWKELTLSNPTDVNSQIKETPCN
ncbi:hypothetical protein [uncultured Flavobacterium sp.]|uniref:hypothetical protein n=1 Tax=uncultured Flavobacterium sp. TaxID=165435 RepID=UPI0012060B15|nr:hypothetical protein [uncultured Flavobacterium sp.]THD33724.1 MAG: hypothetical protein DI588_00910 [Flavobacterium johnsoniae]